MDLVPLSIAIAETPMLIDTSQVPAQSSTKRRWLGADTWRSEGT
jgi:hypothetical protein